MKFSPEAIAALNIIKHSVQPKRNYTLHPQQVFNREYEAVDCQRTGLDTIDIQDAEAIFA